MVFLTEGEKERLKAYKVTGLSFLIHIDNLYRGASRLSKDDYINFLVQKGGVELSDPKSTTITIGFNDEKGTTVYIFNDGLVKIELLDTGVQLLTNTKSTGEINLDGGEGYKAKAGNKTMSHGDPEVARNIPENLPSEVQELILTDSNEDGVLQSKEAASLIGVIISHELADGNGKFSKPLLNMVLKSCDPEASAELQNQIADYATTKLTRGISNIKNLIGLIEPEISNKITTHVEHIEWEDICDTANNFMPSNHPNVNQEKTREK